jgi:serine/threonine protein kinase
MGEKPGKLGKYHILEELGKGGFATVYRALDTTLEREVALKVLDPLLMRDEAWVERFRREARAVARLNHPHIVTIHEIDEADGRLFIAMELVAGPTLKDLIAERGRLSWDETLDILAQVADALDYAHGEGILHRDLKPGNILLDPRRGAVLTDFGFARLVGESSMSTSVSRGVVGTPQYIAPEIWDGQEATSQTDLYALACIAYEMLTGEVLFGGKTPIQVMRAHDRGPQFPARWPQGIPTGVADVLHRALGHEVRTRHGNAKALLDALRLSTTPRANAQLAGDALQSSTNSEYEPRSLSDPTDWVLSVAFSPDGKVLAAGSYSSKIWLWQAPDWVLSSKLEAATGAASGIAFSPDGEMLASGLLSDGTVKGTGVWLWRVSDGALIHRLRIGLPGTAQAALSLTYSQDGELLACSTAGAWVWLWRVADRSVLQRFRTGMWLLRSDMATVRANMALSPDGAMIATGSSDRKVKLHRVSDGMRQRTLQGHTKLVQTVAFSQNGETLASGSEDHTVRLWRASDGHLLRVLDHEDAVLGLAFSPTEPILATGTKGHLVRLWRVSDGVLLRVLEGHSDRVTSVAFSPDGDLLASGSWDRTVRIWTVSADSGGSGDD